MINTFITISFFFLYESLLLLSKQNLWTCIQMNNNSFEYILIVSNICFDCSIDIAPI